jgi:glycosyltransferase involved in cell wall biosynthesis
MSNVRNTQQTTHLHVSLTAFRNESRVLKETATVVAEGLAHRVIVAALHEDGLAEHEFIDPQRSLVRLKLSTRGWPANLLSQAVKYSEFAARVWLLARRHKAKVVSVHTVALLPLSIMLKLLLGARIVYDAHELETEAQGRLGLRRALAKLAERLLIWHVDLTVVVSPGIERWYRDAYGLNRIVTVLNAPMPVVAERSDALHVAAGIEPERKILLYQGALTTGRGIEALLEAASALEGKGYCLVFMGYGELASLVEQAVCQHEYVYLVPAVAPNLVLSYTASANVGLCSIEDSCLSYRLSLPNKLFEYIFAGLPVIASNLPEMAKLIENNDVGVCVDDWNADELVAAVAAIEAMPIDELRLRLRNVSERHNWNVQGAALVRAYRDFGLVGSN